MPIRTVPTSLGATVSLGVVEKFDRDTNAQKRSRDGIPQWTVSVFSKSYREAVNVTVTSPTQPELPDVGGEVELVGLEVGPYAKKGDGAALYFSAQSVRAVAGA